MNSKGQFFSPDLVVAVLLFLIALFFFFITADSIFAKVDLIESKSSADEVSHNLMNVLVYSPGVPFNWEKKSFEEIVIFGLSLEKNVIDKNKLESLIDYLNDDYDLTKEKLGLGSKHIKLLLIDQNGSIIYESNKVFGETKYQLNYDRLVLFNLRQCILRAVVADEK